MYGDLKLCTARQTHNLIRLVFRFRQTNLLRVRSCFDRAFILCYITTAAAPPPINIRKSLLYGQVSATLLGIIKFNSYLKKSLGRCCWMYTTHKCCHCKLHRVVVSVRASSYTHNTLVIIYLCSWALALRLVNIVRVLRRT